jgi:hypothetical protein
MRQNLTVRSPKTVAKGMAINPTVRLALTPIWEKGKSISRNMTEYTTRKINSK